LAPNDPRRGLCCRRRLLDHLRDSQTFKLKPQKATKVQASILCFFVADILRSIAMSKGCSKNLINLFLNQLQTLATSVYHPCRVRDLSIQFGEVQKNDVIAHGPCEHRTRSLMLEMSSSAEDPWR
jgi:hypothetical protein